MNFDRNTRSGICLAVALLSPLMGCGKTSFERGLTSRDSSEIKSDPSADGTQTESTSALEPVLVGGSFLTCQISAENSNQETVMINCRQDIEDQDESLKNLSFKFTSGFSRNEASSITPVSERVDEQIDAGYLLWTFTFRRADIIDSWLYVDIKNSVIDVDTSNKVDIFIPPYKDTESDTIQSPLVTFNSGTQKIGDDGAGRGVEADCEGIDVPGIANGRSKSYQITLPAGGVISLIFSNLCGVGTGQTNTTGAFTTAILRHITGEIAFTLILQNQEVLEFSSPVLAAGEYSLTISPASRNGALNDFAYSNLRIEGPEMLIE
ncbi:MAG: hypothetical protein ACOH5I_03365 [Oligoflexus sp.]